MMEIRSLRSKSLFALVLSIFLALLALIVPPFMRTLAASPAGSKYSVPLVNPGDWPMYGHDVSRTNFNPDETIINAGNVSQLVSRWQMFIGSGAGDPSGAPSVAGGKVFVGSSAPGNNFFAFNAVTGAQAWNVSVGYENSCFNVGIGSTSAISGTVLSVGGGDSCRITAWTQIRAASYGATIWPSAQAPLPGNRRCWRMDVPTWVWPQIVMILRCAAKCVRRT